MSFVGWVECCIIGLEDAPLSAVQRTGDSRISTEWKFNAIGHRPEAHGYHVSVGFFYVIFGAKSWLHDLHDVACANIGWVDWNRYHPGMKTSRSHQGKGSVGRFCFMKQVDRDMQEHVFWIFLDPFWAFSEGCGFQGFVSGILLRIEGFRSHLCFFATLSVCQILEQSGRPSTFGWMLGA